jgi:zinc transport system substrate-binding protein
MSAMAMMVMLAACGSPAPTGKPIVAVSILPQRFLVRRLAGDAVEVVVAVPPGASPHTHLPTDAEMARLRQAARYLRIGVPMENGPWFDAIAGGQRLVDQRVGVPWREIETPAHPTPADVHPDGQDPHIWLSPPALAVQAATVAGALRRLVPDRELDANLTALTAELQALDTELRARLAPYRHRTFLVYHPALGYFADAYGLRQVALERDGLAPGDADLVRLRETVHREGLRILFVQPQAGEAGAARLAGLLGLTVERFDPLAEDLPANLRRLADLLTTSWADPRAGG